MPCARLSEPTSAAHVPETLRLAHLRWPDQDRNGHPDRSCGEERERTRANPEAIGLVQKTQEEGDVLGSDPDDGPKPVQTETPDGGYHRTQILVLLCGPGVKVLPGELRSPGWAVSWLSFRSDQRSGLTRLR